MHEELCAGWSLDEFHHCAAAGAGGVAVDGLDLAGASALAAQLQAALDAREVQLERKAREVASMQDVTQQLMVTPPLPLKPYSP